MFRALTKIELKIPERNTERAAIDVFAKEKLGNESNYEDYKNDPDYNTPLFNMYEKDLSGETKRLL